MILYLLQISLSFIYLGMQAANKNEYDWSEDEEFVAELDERVRKYKAGVDEGYAWDELEASIEQMKQKRTASN